MQGCIVSSSKDYTIRLWDPRAGGEALSSLDGHMNEVSTVQWHRNGHYILSAARDNQLKVIILPVFLTVTTSLPVSNLICLMLLAKLLNAVSQFETSKNWIRPYGMIKHKSNTWHGLLSSFWLENTYVTGLVVLFNAISQSDHSPTVPYWCQEVICYSISQDPWDSWFQRCESHIHIDALVSVFCSEVKLN